MIFRPNFEKKGGGGFILAVLKMHIAISRKYI